RGSGSSRHPARDREVPTAPRDDGPSSEPRSGRPNTHDNPGASRMTAPRDADRLIQTFLSKGETDLPDRAFEAIRRDIHRTRQRVVLGPWREPDMSTIARVAIAAAAVVAIGLASLNFGPPDKNRVRTD